MKILLTGGSGYLAGVIGSGLQNSGHDVFLGKREIVGDEYSQGLKSIRIDYEDDMKISEACKGINVVIHCAGLGARESFDSPELATKVNADNTGRVALASKESGVSLFIYLSTIHVYSESLHGEFNESSPRLNTHPYATSHAKGEDLALEQADYKFKVCVLRLGNVFGAPLQNFGNAAVLAIHDFGLQAIKKGSIEIVSDSQTMRNFVPSRYLVNLVRTLVADIRNQPNSQVLNVTWSHSKTLAEVASTIANIVAGIKGKRPTIFSKILPNKQMAPLIISSKSAQGICPQVTDDFDLELQNLISFIDSEIHFDN